MAPSILTAHQQKALQLIAQTQLAKDFYFSGGTALAYFYLHHRKSEDLDFFHEEEFDPQQVTIILQSLKPKLQFMNLDYQQNLNRNLYFLHFADNSAPLKLEFTYYPFQQIEEPKRKEGLLVDSPIDIAANKLFTISQKARGRDYYDLYFLIQKYGYDLEKLRMLAKQKFDWDIDPLHLGTQLNQIDKHLDDPILLKTKNKSEIITFFQKEMLRLGKEILTQ